MKPRMDGCVVRAWRRARRPSPTGVAMNAVLDQHERAMRGFAEHVHQVRPDQWSLPTPDTEWDVRALVNHLTSEQLWVPALMSGQTPAGVGDAFAGDVLGDDPVAAWDAAAESARAAFADAGALARGVTLSYATVDGERYCREMTSDLLIHSWDLARAIGADETLDPELVHDIHERLLPMAGMLAASGMFAPAVEVDADADEQTRLLALLGRKA